MLYMPASDDMKFCDKKGSSFLDSDNQVYNFPFVKVVLQNLLVPKWSIFGQFLHLTKAAEMKESLMPALL
jgi:hypothetical protein